MRIHERMGVLSRFIDAHSHSTEFHEVPLTVDCVSDELTQLIGDLRFESAWTW
jgi:hypothetical protein